MKGALTFAPPAIAGCSATFAALIRDIAADPLGWLRNLGAAVVDGIRNHLWTALKRAVKEWFNPKLEEVLGLGPAIWNLLAKGGINFAAIGRMAWDGHQGGDPDDARSSCSIEKLVSMIVPAAGALMADHRGPAAAWGTISRILAAFERVLAFLLAVKGGRAGPQFAAALAAARHRGHRLRRQLAADAPAPPRAARRRPDPRDRPRIGARLRRA